VLQRHTLNLHRADTVALKRLFCGDGTSQIGKKPYTAKLLGFLRKPALGGAAAIECLILTNT
jgi:hypothetical protein